MLAMMRRTVPPVVVASLVPLIACAAALRAAEAPALPQFDFTGAPACAEWQAAHDIAGMTPTAEGLEVRIAGPDPYFLGPARDYPDATPLWMILRVKSDQEGTAQVFHFTDHPGEDRSVRFPVPAGDWHELRVALPALGPGCRLRIDPPGTGGTFLLAALRFEPAPSLTAPAWPPPDPVDFAGAQRLCSGPLELLVAPRAFRLLVAGQPVATSHSRPLLGYLAGDALRWLDPGAPGAPAPALSAAPGEVVLRSSLRDADGATWRISRRFTTGNPPGVIDLECSVEVDQDRAVAFLPMLLLVAGEGSPAKGQALLPGLEYLENEPSSSEADLRGPEARRQVPANHKLTFPLLAIQRDGRWLGALWDHGPQFSVLFDSPDRLLGTGGHLMGVLFPGSDTLNRREGDLLPMRPQRLAAGQPLTLTARLLGGPGPSVIPAVRRFVELRGLPPVPPAPPLADYVALAAHGWLDSRIRDGNRFRHAVWGDLAARPAADAPVFMEWLATRTTDAALARRLGDAARDALGAVPPADFHHAAVSHVPVPAAPLVFGHAAENAATAGRAARHLLERFAADGTLPYRKPAGGTDYGSTHFAPDASGLTAQVVASLLEAAMFSGERALVDQALARLRGLDKFRHTVPRGAQTWEIPLHTPDILAAAHLVRAYTLGHELTGDPELLAQAIEWAWTGVPFVYLTPPVGLADRPYGTIPVLGATAWQAPVWMGRPVQWCGLVYADALYQLARSDPAGPWRRLADGITAVGIFYAWPAADAARQGLLPDVWELLAGQRAGPAINPGTVQANAARFYQQGPLLDARVFRTTAGPVIVHAPGEITPGGPAAADAAVRFTVHPWPRGRCHVLVSGLGPEPRLWLDGQPVPLAAPHEFQPAAGRLILELEGRHQVELAP